MAFLERNLEQLTLVQKQVSNVAERVDCSLISISFRQLVDQNSTLKKEAGIAERKLLARNERIQNLEALLQDADRRLSVQNQKFEAQLQAVKERLDQARGKYFWVIHPARLRDLMRFYTAQKAASSSPLTFGRIAKPLRGGGGASAAPAGPVPVSGGGAANPLARIQNEEGGYANFAKFIPGFSN